MNAPAKIQPVSDAVLARASALHDAAFADPKIKEKPSFADSIAAARAEVEETAEAHPEPKPLSPEPEHAA